jgi:hypothetical protein
LNHPAIFNVFYPASGLCRAPIHTDGTKRANGFALAASGAGFGFVYHGMLHPVIRGKAEQVKRAGTHAATTTGAFPGIDAGNGNALSNVHPDVS